jgi:UDP-N-acetylglucosamine--N-acetylmuramyl-(pentapeptide) pyrophosphoryl-undecaprenol N-acetylglucosamine transferase
MAKKQTKSDKKSSATNRETINRPLRILITGGGTGGHVFPAIAIADALKRQLADAEFLFVGANGKMEMERVPKAGYAIEGLNIAGFQRSFSLKNLAFPYKLLSSLMKARSILRRFRPDVVIGTGGYASGPVMRSAQKMGIPTIIQEQNSYAGVTNKLLAKGAAAVCVAYDHMEQFFPAENIIFTGNPVRQDIVQLTGKREEAIAWYGLDPNKKTIAIIGGSLGARTLNNAVRDNMALLAGANEVQLIWQCGRFYEYDYKDSEVAQLPNVHLRTFIDRMDLLYAAADVIISRAGALSISELCLVGKPVILVPSPNVAEDHQTKNAMAYVQAGAAVLLKDAEAVGKLKAAVDGLFSQSEKAQEMGNNLKKLAKPNAATEIVSALESILP